MEIEGALTNAGTVNWQAGVVDVYNDGNGLTGAIWNETNAVWAIQCDEALANAASALAIFNNAGTLLPKSAGSGTTIFNVYLDGSGLVHAQNGTIQFNSGRDFGRKRGRGYGGRPGFCGWNPHACSGIRCVRRRQPDGDVHDDCEHIHAYEHADGWQYDRQRAWWWGSAEC